MSADKHSDYLIAKGESLTDLRLEVLKLMRQGYKPTGGLTMDRVWRYMQAMWYEQ